ncbi:MAG: hypothetical protein H0W84_05675, partial [Bacteroidetes bacterium]|nr:hypothetical protein [Bacteroidota bacterium]
MKKLLTIFFLLPFIINAQSGFFTFQVDTAAHTSAGVFRQSDSVLLKTLWSDVSYAAGTQTGYWDGKDDNGNVVTVATYKRVLLQNVTHTWDGIVGNTSTANTGAGVHR